MAYLLLKCDKPSSITGRVYPRREVEKMVAKYMAKDRGSRLGTFRDNGIQLSLTDVSHRVRKLFINKQNELIADDALYIPKSFSHSHRAKVNVPWRCVIVSGNARKSGY